MRLIRHLNVIPKEIQSQVVAIGNFDGLHLGHQKLLKKAKEIAQNLGKKLVVMTFEPHPMKLTNPNRYEGRIISFRSKVEFLQNLGIDYLLLINFDQDFVKIMPEDFIQKILFKKLRASYVITGEDFYFGYNRLGNINNLIEASKKDHFGYEFLPKYGIDGIFCSTTIIKSYLKNGSIKEAEKILGHKYGFTSRVQRGKGLGSQKLFATANIDPKGMFLPKFGVYSARVIIDDQSYYAAVNIGIRPSFSENIPSIEGHILDFSGDLYGKYLTIELINYIREERKFENLESLKAQITKDIEIVRNEKII